MVNDKKNFDSNKPEDTNDTKEKIKKKENVFYCPICKSEYDFASNLNLKFCSICGYKFPKDENNELIIDSNNFLVFKESNKFKPSNQPNSIDFKRNSQQKRINPQIPPNIVYPHRFPRKKKRNWNFWPGIAIPIMAFVIMFLLSIVPTIFVILFNLSDILNTILNFILNSVSLVFLIVPILWVNRYYPGKLTLKQRLGELGLPLEKYSRNEKFREILLGVLIGFLMVLLSWGLQYLAQFIVNLFYNVNITNFMESKNVEEFALTTPKNLFELILFVLQMLLFVGVSEEILFRGFVQKSFESKLNKSASLLLTAILFSFFHIFLYVLVPPIFLFLFIPYLGVSLILGLLRNWRGDLFAASSAHIAYNCIQIVVVYFLLP